MIPMVFSPGDRVLCISFRMVRDLPYAFVLGSAPNLRPELESPPPTETKVNDLTSVDNAVWEDEVTLDWILRLSNAVSSLPGGTSVQVVGRVKGPQLQSRLLVITEPRDKFNLKWGLVSEVPRGYSGGNQSTHLNASSRTSPPHQYSFPRESL